MILHGNDPYREPSFTLGNRLKRMVWSLVYQLLFRFSPRPFHIWRVLLLRLFGAHIGRGCHIYPSVNVWAPWNLIIGDYSGIGGGATIYCMDKIIIGDYVAISQGAHICGGTHDYNSQNFQLIAKPIVVGSYAWICAEAFIHPGVVVPEGVVIGARAVVNLKLMQPWGVYAGNPCRLVGTRNQLIAAKRSKPT